MLRGSSSPLAADAALLTLQALFFLVSNLAVSRSLNTNLQGPAPSSHRGGKSVTAAAEALLRRLLSGSDKKDGEGGVEQRMGAARLYTMALIWGVSVKRREGNTTATAPLIFCIILFSALRAVWTFSLGRIFFRSAVARLQRAAPSQTGAMLVRAIAAGTVFAVHLLLQVIVARARSLHTRHIECLARKHLLDAIGSPASAFANPFAGQGAAPALLPPLGVATMMRDAVHALAQWADFNLQCTGWLLGVCLASPQLLRCILSPVAALVGGVRGSGAAFSPLLAAEAACRSMRLADVLATAAAAALFAVAVNAPPLLAQYAATRRHGGGGGSSSSFFFEPTLRSTARPPPSGRNGGTPLDEKLRRWAPVLAEVLRQAAVLSDPQLVTKAEVDAVHAHLLKRTGIADFLEPTPVIAQQPAAAASAGPGADPAAAAAAATSRRRSNSTARREAAAAALAAEIETRRAADSPFSVGATLTSRADLFASGGGGVWTMLASSAAATLDAVLHGTQHVDAVHLAPSSSSASAVLMWLAFLHTRFAMWRSNVDAAEAASRLAPILVAAQQQQQQRRRSGDDDDGTRAVGRVELQRDPSGSGKLVGTVATLARSSTSSSSKQAETLDFHLYPGAGLLVAVEDEALLDRVAHSIAAALERALQQQPVTGSTSAVAVQVVPADPLVVPAMCLSDQITFPARARDVADTHSQWDLFQLLQAVGLEHLVEADGDAWDRSVCASAANESVLHRCDIRLSPTQRQQLALARVLLRRPRYVVLAGATFGGDQKLLQRVTASLKAAGVSIVSVVACSALRDWTARCDAASVHYSGLFLRGTPRAGASCNAAFGILQNPPPTAAPIHFPSAAVSAAAQEEQQEEQEHDCGPDTFLLFSRVIARN